MSAHGVLGLAALFTLGGRNEPVRWSVTASGLAPVLWRSTQGRALDY
jgi:hypothetical protein